MRRRKRGIMRRGGKKIKEKRAGAARERGGSLPLPPLECLQGRDAGGKRKKGGNEREEERSRELSPMKRVSKSEKMSCFSRRLYSLCCLFINALPTLCFFLSLFSIHRSNRIESVRLFERLARACERSEGGEMPRKGRRRHQGALLRQRNENKKLTLQASACGA